MCQNFQVKNCFPIFRSKFLLNADDVEEIEIKKTESKMTQKLIDILMKKDVKVAFETIFEYVTERCYQGNLAKTLREAYKEAKNEADDDIYLTPSKQFF